MLPTLQAEQRLTDIETASMPHMKDGDRRTVFNRLTSMLRRDERAKPVRPTRDQLAAIGVQVITVSAEQWERGEQP